MKSCWTIVDAQYGSTGKGLIAGYLAKQRRPDTVICAWSPNAGHTFIDEGGRKYVHCMIPNGVVSPGLRRVLIGPGALIDPDLMMREIQSVRDHLDGVVFAIHEHAGVCLPIHAQREQEMGLSKIGSTTKGVMAAQIDRMRRHPDNLMVAKQQLRGTPLEKYLVGRDKYTELLHIAQHVQVEGAQGFSLSMYHGHYPYVTSRDVTVHQIFADCGLPNKWASSNEVIATLRTYPIRVNNRDGTSGPGYPDQYELDWKDINVLPELTTVTKLPRRIFTFSMHQLRHAADLLTPDAWFLNFCNYMDKADLEHRLIPSIKFNTGVQVSWTGWGPTEGDVREQDWE